MAVARHCGVADRGVCAIPRGNLSNEIRRFFKIGFFVSFDVQGKFIGKMVVGLSNVQPRNRVCLELLKCSFHFQFASVGLVQPIAPLQMLPASSLNVPSSVTSFDFCLCARMSSLVSAICSCVSRIRPRPLTYFTAALCLQSGGNSMKTRRS